MTSKRARGLYYYGELVFAFSDCKCVAASSRIHNNGQIYKARVDNFIQDFNLSDPWDKNCMN